MIQEGMDDWVADVRAKLKAIKGPETVYVVLLNSRHAAIHKTEAGARDFVLSFLGPSTLGYKEVSKNRWEWEDFSIMIEEKELYE